MYDNSAPELRSLARFDRGRVVAAANDMPAWAAQALREPLAAARDRALVTREAAAYLESKRTTATTQAVVEEDVARRTRVSGPVLVKGAQYVAIGTGPWSFAVLDQRTLDRELKLRDYVRLELKNGKAYVRQGNEQSADRGRRRGR